MIPSGFEGVETQLWLWLIAMIRPGAAFLAAPIFGAAHVPVQVRLIISLAVGIPAMSVVPFVLPPDGFTSIAGFALVAGEILAGLALGFSVQIGFSAALLAGETMGNVMGLGFAAMIDPLSGQQSQVLGQFLTVLGTFLFLAMGGHLLLAMIIFESYKALPPGEAWLTNDALRGLVRFGGTVFAAGLAIALPVGFAVVLVQLVMAMLARSAPALNLFSVGLPAAVLAGLVLIAFAAPSLAEAITRSMTSGLEYARTLSVGGS